MDSWQARFESFSKRKRVKQGSTTTILKWPHPPTFLSTPETLAEAGFYYTPTAGAPDTVQCFACSKKLADWEAEDDPFAEHVLRGSSCYWAIARCGLKDDMDEDGSFVFLDPARIPSNKAMEKARLDSYASHWPHDQVKGHSASSKKMAQAGFVYTPQGPGDDTTTCFYCGTSLSGWENGDDPREEHHKREEKARKQCPFFATSTPQAQIPKPTGRPTSRSQSKSTSANTTKNKSKTQEALSEELSSFSLSSDEDVDPAAAPPSSRSRSAASKRSISTRSSTATAKTPASKHTSRSVSRPTANSKSAVASETEDDVEASGSEAGKRVSKNKKKGTGKSKERIEAIQEEEEVENVVPEERLVEAPVPPKRKRGRPPKNKAVASTTNAAAPLPDGGNAHNREAAASDHSTQSRTRSKVHVESESDAPIAPSAKPKAKSSVKGKARPAPTPDNEMPPPPLPSETSKGSSEKTRRLAGSDVDEGHFEDPVPTAKARTKSKPKTKEVPTISVPDLANAAFLAVPEESRAKQPVDFFVDPASSKPKNRKSSSTSDDAGYATAEHGMDVDAEPPELRDPPSGPQPQQDASSAFSQRSSSIENSSARHGSVRPGRSSSRPASGMVRSSSRLNTEVVDISSSDEEAVLPTPSSKPQKTAVETTTHMPSFHLLPSERPVRATSNRPLVDEESGNEKPRQKPDALPATVRGPNRGARPSKLVVEVVAPPPSSTRRAEKELPADIDMTDATSPPPDVDSALAPPLQLDDPLPSRTSPPATPPPRTPSLPPTDTELPKSRSRSSAAILPSFDEEMEEELVPSTEEPLASFTPFLSMVPLSRLSSLPEEDHELTLEQYIRREIERQYQQFKEDAERKIALFEAKAAETRRAIESA